MWKLWSNQEELWYQTMLNDIEKSKKLWIKLNKEISEHLRKYYDKKWILDIDWFLYKTQNIVDILYHQPWEEKNFWSKDIFLDFLTKIIKLHILYYNLELDGIEKLTDSTFECWLMYWELLKYWEKLTINVKQYLEKNRHNEQKKEEIKELVERDYEIYFWESTKWKMLSTKVWQTTNDIIEVFSNWYYGSLDNKHTTK